MEDGAVLGHLDPPGRVELWPEIYTASHTNPAQHVVEYCFSPGGRGQAVALIPVLFRCHIPCYSKPTLQRVFAAAFPCHGRRPAPLKFWLRRASASSSLRRASATAIGSMI